MSLPMVENKIRYQQIKKYGRIDFDEYSKYIFDETLYEKEQKIEKCEKLILINIQDNVLVRPLFTYWIYIFSLNTESSLEQ